MGGETFKKKKIKRKPEVSTTLSVFMGLGIYEAVWLLFSGMSGLCCTPVLGCVQAGATWTAVKTIVKEIPAFGSWEASFFDVLISLSLPTTLPSVHFCASLPSVYLLAA